MKIYSLQEENEKMNAARGQQPFRSNRGSFEMKQPSSTRPRQGRPVPSNAEKKRPVAESTRKSVPSSPGRQQTQPRHSSSMSTIFKLIWIVFILFIFVINILTNS